MEPTMLIGLILAGLIVVFRHSGQPEDESNIIPVRGSGRRFIVDLSESGLSIQQEPRK